MTDAMPDSWKSYYEKTGDRPPRETLLFALDKFDGELTETDRHFAIDLHHLLIDDGPRGGAGHNQRAEQDYD